MVKYFACVGLLKSSWDQVCIAFWERYPNPYSNHVLTEDIIFRDVTPGNRLVSRRLLTKTNRAPRWMEKYLPVTMARHAYIIEDSIVDPQNRTMTTLTWNISHARMMEFGLARFKTSVTKTMKGFEYVLAKMQGEAPSRTMAEHATERARETALAAKEKAKDLASQAHKKQQYV
ncbi:PRELI domain-containing protein 1, mitochondrial-like isoform 2-T5 [Salvelinus alpinus]|uniref:PRELI domain-containing protein 1, mitochondrial-like isoform X4 n=1 Tax=Salvelinus fontinalis TaxID=8038 RepID=UPI002485468E|nr:PRELI domain-containing protein 1, mitochondrial-like isoform X4 [Salvelinus fontinalis]